MFILTIFLSLWAACGRGKLYLGQSIGIDENNSFRLNFLLYHLVGATVFGGLWAWHAADTNLHCSGICMPNPSSLALIVSEISAFIRTDRQTESRTDGHG